MELKVLVYVKCLFVLYVHVEILLHYYVVPMPRGVFRGATLV